MATGSDADNGSTPPRQPGVGRYGFCGSQAKFVPIVDVALEFNLEPSQLIRLAKTLSIDLWFHPAKKVTWGPYDRKWFGRTLASEYQPTPPATPARAVVAIVDPLDHEPYVARHVRSCGQEYPGWSAELSSPHVLNIEDILVEEQLRIGFVERVKLHFDSLLVDVAADLADLPGPDQAPPQETTGQVVPTYDHVGVLALHELIGLNPSKIIRLALAMDYSVVFQLDNVHVNWTKQRARVPSDVEELSIDARLGRVQGVGESYAAYWKRSIRESMEPEDAAMSARAGFERQIQNGRARRESGWVSRRSEIPGIDDYDTVKIAHVKRWPIQRGTAQFGLLLDEDGSPGVIIPSADLKVPRAFAVELAQKLDFAPPPRVPSASPAPAPAPVHAATAEQMTPPNDRGPGAKSAAPPPSANKMLKRNRLLIAALLHVAVEAKTSLLKSDGPDYLTIADLAQMKLPTSVTGRISQKKPESCAKPKPGFSPKRLMDRLREACRLCAAGAFAPASREVVVIGLLTKLIAGFEEPLGPKELLTPKVPLTLEQIADAVASRLPSGLRETNQSARATISAIFSKAEAELRAFKRAK